MKRSLHIGGIVAAGVLVALCILGLFVDHVSINTTHYVAAPVDRAWVTFMDDNRLTEWVSNLVASETITPADGEGSSFCRHYYEGGIVVDQRVIAIEPFERFETGLETWFFTARMAVSFAPQGNGTRIDQVTLIEGTTFLWRAILPATTPWIRAGLSGDLKALARLIENNPSAVPKNKE